MDAFFALMAGDAVQEMPYAPPGFPAEVVGREAIAALFAGFPEATHAVRFPGLVIHETDGPDRLIAEVGGHIEFKAAAEPYRRSYITVFEFRDGLIARIREYFDPIPFAEATGLGRYVAN